MQRLFIKNMKDDALKELLFKNLDIVKDFPKKGINFYDINPLFKNTDLWFKIIENMSSYIKENDIDCIFAIESRGFLIAPALAIKTGLPFGLIRKEGKLPCEVERVDSVKEYGTDVLEVQKKAKGLGKKAVIVDDILATGGTVEASIKLLEKIGIKTVAVMFLFEINYLHGRQKVNVPIYSLGNYD